MCSVKSNKYVYSLSFCIVLCVLSLIERDNLKAIFYTSSFDYTQYTYKYISIDPYTYTYPIFMCISKEYIHTSP